MFMMSMEIERLSEDNRQLRIEKEEWSSMDRLREVSHFKEQNERMAASRNNSMKIERERAMSN